MSNSDVGYFEEKIKANTSAMSKIPSTDQEELRKLVNENNKIKIELIGKHGLDIKSPVHLLYSVMGNYQHGWFHFPHLSEFTGIYFSGDENSINEYKKLASDKNIKLNLYPKGSKPNLGTPNIIVDEIFSEDLITDFNLFPIPGFKGIEIDLGPYNYMGIGGEVKRYKNAVVEITNSKEAPHVINMYIKEKGIKIGEGMQIRAKECSLYPHPLVPTRKTPKEITFLGTFSISVDDEASFAFLTGEYLKCRLKPFNLPEKTFKEIFDYMGNLDVYCEMWKEHVNSMANGGYIISNSPKSRKLTKFGLAEVELPQRTQELLARDKEFIYSLKTGEGLDKPKYITKLFAYSNAFV